MRHLTLVGIALAALCLATSVSAVPKQPAVPIGTGLGQRVPPFTADTTALVGDAAKKASFDSQKTTRVTAYIFVGTTCPATNAYAERLQQLAQTYTPKGVDFVYLYPNRNDTSDAKLAFHNAKHLGGRLIDDQGARLAQLFHAQRTSEVFLTDAHGIVVYHGAIDDSRDPSKVKQRYLSDALDAVLAKQPIKVANTDVFA